VGVPCFRYQETSIVSKWPVQGTSIEEAAGARRELDLQNQPVRPAGPCALGPAETGAPSEVVAPPALVFHLLDAATELLARPLFRARIGDAR
jgi:hypothetical protein